MENNKKYIPFNLENIPDILNDIEKSLIDDTFFDYAINAKYDFDSLPSLDDNDLNELGVKFKRYGDIVLFIGYAPHPATLLTMQLEKLQKQLVSEQSSVKLD